jgi:antirestriction protein ArdC
MTKIEDTFALVGERIIASLDAGEAPPWVKGWSVVGDGMPHNPLTGRPYSGSNLFLLLALNTHGDPRFAGASQWMKAGNPVRKGEHGMPIFFPRFKCSKCAMPVAPWMKVCKRGHSIATDADRAWSGWGESFVFNNLQTSKPLPPMETNNVDPAVGFDRAAEVVSRIGANVKHGGARASYSPVTDEINMPNAGAFANVADYWATLMHEHVHWTGAKGRCERDGIVKFDGFGSEQYAFEELIAEIGSAFACAHLGVHRDGLIENHTAYIASWKKKISEDPMCVRKAASQAATACTFLMKKGGGLDRDDGPEESE